MKTFTDLLKYLSQLFL